MARKYARPLLAAMAIPVTMEIVRHCKWCSTGTAPNTCQACNDAILREMDRLALEGSQAYLAAEYDRAAERISEDCELCYGDGRIHTPWGRKQDWSAMVLCADPKLGLRLGENVIVGPEKCEVDHARGIGHKFEQYRPKWHFYFAQAMGVWTDARIDLGAHPHDGLPWDDEIGNFDAVAFVHHEQILAVQAEEKRPKESKPMTANHAYPSGQGLFNTTHGVIVDITEETHETEVSVGNILVQGRHGTSKKVRKKLFEVVASAVDGVQPGNSVVVLSIGALEAGEFYAYGRRLAKIQPHDILCKGEIET